MRKSIVLGLLASAIAVAAVTAMPAGGNAPGQNGRIAFALFDPALDGTETYTANPDGSHVEQLFSAAPSGEPRWSPDGSEVAILAPCSDGEENCAVTIVDPDTGTFRQLKMPDPTLFTGCLQWSPDSKRFACAGFGEPDSSRCEQEPAGAPGDRLATARRTVRRKQAQFETEAGDNGGSRGGSKGEFHSSGAQSVVAVDSDACAPAARTAAERVAMS